VRKPGDLMKSSYVLAKRRQAIVAALVYETTVTTKTTTQITAIPI